MTTEVDPLYIAGVKTRRSIIVVSLVYIYSLIAYLLIVGNPENSLHQSALSWSFIASLGIIFAYSFGIIINKYFK
jgi:hypothetical protein